MSRLAKAIQSRREISRNRRALEHAISNAATPAMRDDLILAAQRTDGTR
jgi:hypothetical protein